MKITFASLSHQGGRDANQDRTGVKLGTQSACFFVCDGVAGLPGGEQAAQIVCHTLLSALNSEQPLTPQQTQTAIEQCHLTLRRAQRINTRHSRMSTTLAALFINRVNQQCWWAHAGDSRIYHFRHGYIHQVTTDHSLTQRLKDAGYEDGCTQQHLIYNALGTATPQQASFSEPLSLEDGDAFLICTDGFWSALTEREMEQALQMVNCAKEWLSLMQQAITRNSKDAKTDNLSAVAVWIGAPQEATLLHSLSDSVRLLPPRDE